MKTHPDYKFYAALIDDSGQVIKQSNRACDNYYNAQKAAIRMLYQAAKQNLPCTTHIITVNR